MALPMQDCIVLFGDSITNRQDVPGTLQTLMCEAYRRTLDVLNRGFGGYNTNYGKTLFDKIFAPKSEQGAPQVRLVTIWFGANDSVLPGPNGGQHVPLSTYRSNLEFFLESLTSLSSPYAAAHSPLSIVLITPPPIDSSTWTDSDFGGAVRKPETIKQYVDVVLELAEEWGKKGREGNEKWRVEGVNMWQGVKKAAENDQEGLASYFTDGLHLSSKGYNVFWQQYTKLVKGPLKGRGLDWDDLEDCPPRVPLWDDVDTNNPNSAVEGMKHAPIHSA